MFLIVGLVLAAPVPLLALPSGRYGVEVSVNGSVPGKFLVDTGATSSAITQAWWDSLGNGASRGERITMYGIDGRSNDVVVARGVALGIGELRVDRMDLLLLTADEPLEAGLVGVLGMDLMGQYVVDVNPTHHQFELLPAGTRVDASGMSAVRLEAGYVRPTTRLDVSGSDQLALIDLGASVSVALPGSQRLPGVALDPSRTRDLRGIAGRMVPHHLLVVDHLALGEMHLTRAPMWVRAEDVASEVSRDADDLAIVGVDLLRGRRVVLDVARDEMAVSTGPLSGAGTANLPGLERTPPTP